ncbi:MAG: glutamate synthase central domain-containing protein, partial [Fibrobacterota bacterium]
MALHNSGGHPIASGLYNPANEHDSCGVGMVASLDGMPDHSIVQKGIKVLVNLEHRGAKGGDKSTGDGAGILTSVPHDFFQNVCTENGIELPQPGKYGVGFLFLPVDAELSEKCINAVQTSAAEEGQCFLGWRDVPVKRNVAGKISAAAMPEFKQFFVAAGPESSDDFERKLYVLRRKIENIVSEYDDGDYSQFYIVSLSSRTVVYKGMLTGTQLPDFYEDLQNPLFRSPFSLVHQRYSTNTMPTWSLAQPFRYLAHNGEINTLRGNINRMRAREHLLDSPLFGKDIEKIKPVIQENGSDSACFDNALELLVQGGRSLAHSMMMMVPEAWGTKYHISKDKRAFYEYHSAIMEPWDGPAALVFTDGRYIGAMLDRNGLRPARYTVTREGTIVMASESGVLDFPGDDILKRGRLQPGKMFLVDLEQHRIIPDNEVKSVISRQKPYRHWVEENRISLRGLLTPSEETEMSSETLRRRHFAFGYKEDELRNVLAPMCTYGQEAIGSMGDDSALAVLSKKPQLLFSYFRQLFAQVTNPPIDPYREELVMSLMSYAG